MTTFGEWMKAVDREVMKRSGLSVHDLADYRFRDAYDDEAEPADVAVEMLEDEGFPFD